MLYIFQRIVDMTYPGALPQGVQAKLVGDLGCVHGVGQILLVGEDEEESVTELVLVEHALELLTGLDNTVAIVGVDDENDTLGVLEVCRRQLHKRVASREGSARRTHNASTEGESCPGLRHPTL